MGLRIAREQGLGILAELIIALTDVIPGRGFKITGSWQTKFETQEPITANSRRG
jgi:hypothetical protein